MSETPASACTPPKRFSTPTHSSSGAELASGEVRMALTRLHPRRRRRNVPSSARPLRRPPDEQDDGRRDQAGREPVRGDSPPGETRDDRRHDERDTGGDGAARAVADALVETLRGVQDHDDEDSAQDDLAPLAESRVDEALLQGVDDDGPDDRAEPVPPTTEHGHDDDEQRHRRLKVPSGVT